MIGCFVTATDTGVGKTLVAATLLQALAQHRRRVVGMKPVAAGVVRIGDGWHSEDAMALRAASTIKVPPELDNPVLRQDPLSPHIAAERAGARIDIGHIVACYHELARRADAVVVEGAGGFHVPLSETDTGADLAQALALPMVLVVGLRLGCLNHAVLTAEAIRARGLALAGWVANRIDPLMDSHPNVILHEMPLDEDDPIVPAEVRLESHLERLPNAYYVARTTGRYDMTVVWRDSGGERLAIPDFARLFYGRGPEFWKHVAAITTPFEEVLKSPQAGDAGKFEIASHILLRH